MKIWLLKPVNGALMMPIDSIRRFVVIALDEAGARDIANASGADEVRSVDPYFWIRDDLSTCEEIGQARREWLMETHGSAMPCVVSRSIGA